MLDIVYKKVSTSADPVETPVSVKNTISTEQTLPPFREPSWYERTSTFFNHLGGYVQQKTTGATPEKLQLRVKRAQKTVQSIKLKEEKRARIKKKGTELVGKTKKGLSTTHGKLLVVHSIALVAIAGYAYHIHPIFQSTPKASASTTTTLADTLTRRYLPAVANTTSQPFDETQAVLPRATLGLYRWVTPWGIQSSTDTAASDQTTYAGQSAFWLTVTGDGSTVSSKADWSIWSNFDNTTTPTYLSVSGDPNITSNVLANPTIQQANITALLNTVNVHGFDGIDIDYEGLGSSNRDLFTKYIQTLTAAFHADNKKVAVTLEAGVANEVPMDWHALGSIVDEARIMVYDYHSSTTDTPGPIAPLGWVQEVTSYAVNQIPPSKVIIGLGNYGYDWQPSTDGSGSWTGIGISADEATALAQQEKASIVRMTGIDDQGYDIGSIPSFVYTDVNGVQHSVWYEDAQSLQDKINIVSQYPVKGVIFWSIGLGNPDLTVSTDN